MPHYFTTCGGMAYNAVELTVVLANHAPVYGVVARPVLEQGWFRGWRRSG
jgi:hypothetical protein